MTAQGTLRTRAPASLLVVRVLCWLLAAAAVGWALLDPRFRDNEGFLLGTACWPVAIGVALLLAGSAIPTTWRTSGALLSLALVGHASALQMIDAGPRLHYQHYQTWAWVAEHARWPFLVLILQTIVVLASAMRSWPQWRDWLARQTRPWQVATLGVAFVLTGATLSRDAGFYIQELGVAVWVRSINIAILLFAAMAVPDDALASIAASARRRARWLFAGNHGVDRVVLAAALWTTVLSAVLCVLSYERHPHLGDEVSYLYQARYLATGVLTMPAPSVLDAFNLDLFNYDALRWYASPPSGWPMILAVGVAAGAAWLVNPLLAGACVILTWALVRDLYDARTARIAAILLAVSPWHVLVGMTYMTHTASLACALAAACGITKTRRTGHSRWAFVSGLATGMVGMIRPLEGIVVAGLLGLWIIGVGGKRLSLVSIVNWGVGCLLIGVAIGFYNASLTGSPTSFPIMVWADRFMGVDTNALGFGPDRGVGWALDPFPGHGVKDAIVNANLNITTIDTELFGWGAGSLLLVLLRSVIWPWRAGDKLMMACMAAVFTAHFFYWFSGGPDFAARYWYLMIVPLVALSASGFNVLAGVNDERAPERHRVNPRAVFVVGSLVALSLVNFLPWRAIDKYHRYVGMRADARELGANLAPRRSLVLVRGRHFPDFASAATYNPIDLNADAPVFAWDSNAPQRARLLEQYADRPIWIVEGPSLTGKGYEIVEGPLTADSLRRRDLRSAETGQWNPPYAERLPEDFGPLYTRPRVP